MKKEDYPKNYNEQPKIHEETREQNALAAQLRTKVVSELKRHVNSRSELGLDRAIDWLKQQEYYRTRVHPLINKDFVTDDNVSLGTGLIGINEKDLYLQFLKYVLGHDSTNRERALDFLKELHVTEIEKFDQLLIDDLFDAINSAFFDIYYDWENRKSWGK